MPCVSGRSNHVLLRKDCVAGCACCVNTAYSCAPPCYKEQSSNRHQCPDSENGIPDAVFNECGTLRFAFIDNGGLVFTDIDAFKTAFCNTVLQEYTSDGGLIEEVPSNLVLATFPGGAVETQILTIDSPTSCTPLDTPGFQGGDYTVKGCDTLFITIQNP